MPYPYPIPRPTSGSMPGTTLKRTGYMNRTGYADGAIVWDSEVGGGYRPVSTVAERDSIVVDMRRQGMWVHTLDNNHVYELQADLVSWTDLGVAGAVGTPGTNGTNGAPGTNGTNGTNGAPGTPGSVLRNGTGVPSNGLGIDGDYYLEDATGDLYLKSSGTYSVVANLKGPAGAGSTLSNNTPQSTGVAGSGVGSEASRSDHIHALGDMGTAYPAQTLARLNLSLLL